MSRWFGSFYVLILICVLTYIAVTIIRKHRLSRFQWVWLIISSFVVFFTIVVDFGYFGLAKYNTADSCGYFNNIFFGTGDMFLYNMSILIGYKMYTVTDNLF